jgi:tetratricopeptide (TPR) repeat protein
MWASAVLHYQRAVAREPNRAFYHRTLGNAYARLDFYARALDVLESARRLSVNPGLSMEIETEIKDIKNLQDLKES